MALIKSLPISAFVSNRERDKSVRTKINVSYALEPSNTNMYPHDQSRKMYCDILGRKYCQTCFEETLRETSFVRSLTSAEDYISRTSALPSRTEYTVHSSKDPSQANDRSENFGDKDRLEHIVNYVFPIMYRSLSLTSSKAEQSRTREDSSSTVTLQGMDRHRHTSGNVSMVSVKSLDSTENFGDDECSLASELDEKARGNFSKQERRRLPIIPRRTQEEFRKSNVRHPVRVETEIEEEQDDDFDGKNVLDLRRELPSKSYQHLVRRSSIVARHVRNRANEKIKVQIAKWTPSIFDEYPRARSVLRRGSNFAKQKREASFRKQTGTIIQSSSSQISTSYLEKLKQPKVVESILPMEPVICGITYIRNRWKDEALYKNNTFAIKLGLVRT